MIPAERASTSGRVRQWMRALAIGVASGAWAVSAAAQAPAQPDPLYGRNPRLQVRPLTAPDGRFSVEYPRSNWIVLPGGGNVVLSLAQRNGEALVQIRRATLKTTLAPEEITDLFAQIEVESLREQDPGAAGFESRLLDAGGRRLIIIQFSQPGLTGPTQVRQYSIPRGQELYRLICSAAAAVFPKYSAVFSHIAASFTPS